MALHLRGNTEAFMRAASKHKKLRIENGSHVHPSTPRKDGRIRSGSSITGSKASSSGVMDEPPDEL